MGAGSRAGLQHQRGMALLAALLLVALMGLGLSLAGPGWKAGVQREREQEWLRIGQLYAKALGAYVGAAPGSFARPPQNLADLLTDTRFVGVRRHLRSIYPDPLRPGQPWALLLDADQRIVGVRSLSSERLFLQPGAHRLALQRVGPGDLYSDWAFVIPSFSSTSQSAYQP